MSEKKIKIFQIIARLNVGGASVYTLELAEQLQKLGYESWLINGRASPAEGEMLDYIDRGKYSFRHHEISELGRSIHPIKDLMVLWKLCRLFIREKPDIIHSHTSKAGFLARFAAMLTRTRPRIHSVHGTIFSGYFGKWSSRLFMFLEKWLGKYTDIIFTDADMVKKELLQLGIGKEEYIKVLPIGIDLEPYRELAPYKNFLRNKLKLSPEVRIVGTVARLVPIKGVDVFLRAAALVLRENDNLVFVVTGDGELRDELRQMAQELGIAGKVHFMGFWKDLREIYADMDVSVLSSHSEGCPVAILEAMACKIPIVASAVGGVPDVVIDQDNGLLVPDHAPELMAQAILRVLREPDLAQKMAHQGFEMAFGKFSIQGSVALTEKYYGKCLEDMGKGA